MRFVDEGTDNSLSKQTDTNLNIMDGAANT
jgi:hypothetical protein